MKVGEVLRSGRPCFSFEFFPPKTDAGVETLLETIRSLRILNPAFVSVTYGAGGSTRARTFEVARRIKVGTRDRGAGARDLRRQHARRTARHLSRISQRRESRTCWRCAATRRKGEARFERDAGRFSLRLRADRDARERVRLRRRRRGLSRDASGGRKPAERPRRRPAESARRRALPDRRSCFSTTRPTSSS